jgi:hypothetical protein
MDSLLQGTSLLLYLIHFALQPIELGLDVGKVGRRQNKRPVCPQKWGRVAELPGREGEPEGWPWLSCLRRQGGPRAAQRDASNDVGAAQNQEQADGCPSHMRILLLLDAVALLLGMAEKSSAPAALPYRRRRSRKSMSLISYPAASRASMTSSLTVTWRLAASSRNLAAK